MKLLHNGIEIGVIDDVCQEGVWMNGRVSLTAAGDELRPFFDYMTDEEHGLDKDPPFAPSLLSPENWCVVKDNAYHGIEVPTVHSGGIIEWRLR